MNYTFRSKLLIFIGKYIYGDPKAFGVNCTADEFYALENERVKANTALHPATAGHWSNMKSQLYKNEMRLTVFKHVSYISVILAVAVLSFGNMANKGFVFVGEKVSVIKSNYKVEKQAKVQLNYLIEQTQSKGKEISEQFNNTKNEKQFIQSYVDLNNDIASRYEIIKELVNSKSITIDTGTDAIYDISAVRKEIDEKIPTLKSENPTDYQKQINKSAIDRMNAVKDFLRQEKNK
ncbi:hypothetical protein ACO0KY_19495 [Undibacterium sp. Dicai25W]|uniref:hypothetical protein n=1 Tax=Undibacterium sp. Dicai25W TaxID=3413034 RepID=UPI003BEF629F